MIINSGAEAQDDRRTCTTFPNGVAIQNRYDKAGALLSTKSAVGACNPADPGRHDQLHA